VLLQCVVIRSVDRHDRSTDLITTHYNNTTDYVLLIWDHSLVFKVTVPDAVYIQYELLKMSVTMLETCRGL